jgi:hypothetical protein
MGMHFSITCLGGGLLETFDFFLLKNGPGWGSIRDWGVIRDWGSIRENTVFQLIIYVH